jgi:hypothetical protein
MVQTGAVIPVDEGSWLVGNHNRRILVDQDISDVEIFSRPDSVGID